jgi:hypothetical protein
MTQFEPIAEKMILQPTSRLSMLITAMRKYIATLTLVLGGVLALNLGCQGQPAKEAPPEGKVSTKSERVAIDMKNVRQPAVAGSFYPADSSSLTKQIEDFLARVPNTEINGEIVALISPHAGYMYSGEVAACAYKLLEGLEFEAVVVIAPSHRFPFQGASVYYSGGYQIPLGLLPVHQELAERIMAQAEIIDFFPQAHSREHALEVQLPFLKMVLGDFNLVPIVMGSQDIDTCRKLAKAVADSVSGRKVLIVASSDLSHFHNYDTAVELDSLVQNRVSNFDAEGLSQDLQQRVCEACGGGPMVTALMAAKLLGADQTKVLKYANSGDVTGDNRQVVGYMAAVIYKSSSANKTEAEGGGKEEHSKVGIDMGLTPEEKQELHRIARTTIEKLTQGETPPDFSPITPTLEEKRGAFVTLKKKGQLRGCIGYIQAVKPLYTTIQEMAQAAAFKDPRFPPVTMDDVPELDIEISVLTPLKKIDKIEEIEVGRHGIYVKQGFHSGLLLPQVATENNWDRLTFLQNTCRKAGLPSNAWRTKNIEIYTFSADIF